MKYLKSSGLLIAIAVMIGCTHTRIVSFTDPDAHGKLYNSIAVVADVNDLSDQFEMENKMVETLHKKGVNAISSLALFPPTREFTIAQENEILAKKNIEALVVLQISDAGYFTTTDGISVHTNSDEDGSETTVHGGGTDNKPFGQFRVSLIDLASDKTMWIGDADASTIIDTDNPDWDMRNLLKGSSKKIANELVKSGLVRTNK